MYVHTFLSSSLSFRSRECHCSRMPPNVPKLLSIIIVFCCTGEVGIVPFIYLFMLVGIVEM